jgi:hypothetical protein
MRRQKKSVQAVRNVNIGAHDVPPHEEDPERRDQRGEDDGLKVAGQAQVRHHHVRRDDPHLHRDRHRDHSPAAKATAPTVMVHKTITELISPHG